MCFLILGTTSCARNSRRFTRTMIAAASIPLATAHTHLAMPPGISCSQRSTEYALASPESFAELGKNLVGGKLTGAPLLLLLRLAIQSRPR